MKAKVEIIFLTYDIRENSVKVLIHKNHLPTKRVTNDTPKEAVKTISRQYIDVDPDFINFELAGHTYDKTTRDLALYFHAFLPSPVANKRGEWKAAWETFREEGNEAIFEILEDCTNRTFRRIQAGPINLGAIAGRPVQRTV